MLFKGLHVYAWIACMAFFIAVQVIREKQRTRRRVVEIALVYALGIDGLSGIASFFGHLLFGERIAESVGWPAGNPFQMEMAFANLAVGVIGCLVLWRRDFIAPAAIAKSIFSAGAGATHLWDLAAHANLAPNNAGPLLYWDFVRPLLFMGLLVAYRRTGKPYVDQGGRSEP
jgi:hypothetical protein